MGHRADESFFDEKREWSKRKDLMLGYYLVPYLPAMATQRRPILVVDGFAGPGEFADGEAGSPLIISRIVENARRTGLKVEARCWFVEKKPILVDQLRRRVARFPNTEVISGTFNDALTRVEAVAGSSSVFLYVDPYTLDGIEWASIDRILRYLSRGSSIELLMNFNIHSFCRRGFAALKVARDVERDVVPEEGWEPGEDVQLDVLNRAIGGDWWQDIARNNSYLIASQLILQRFCDQLQSRFNEVCVHEVKEHWRHKVPKYALVFGSRHPRALELMNDAACKSREMLAQQTTPSEPLLFESRPESVVPDPARLRGLVLKAGAIRGPRIDLVMRVIRAAFGVYSSSEIRRHVSSEIANDRMMSATGKSRINDDIDVWTTTSV